MSNASLSTSSNHLPTSGAVWFWTLAVVGTIIIAASAKIKVPMWPVEMSLQTLAILLVAAAFGLRLGLTTILLYLAEGSVGLPVFQGTPEKGVGLSYMMGPTGGYLLGFVAMVAVVGLAADRGWVRSPSKICMAMLLGEAALLALGAMWLAYLFGPAMAIEYGVGPFIIADLLKVGIAAALAFSWTRLSSDLGTL